MKIKCNLKLGNSTYQFEVDEKTELESLHKAIILTNPKHSCLCKEPNIEDKYFTTNKDKEGNIYVNVKCGRCKGRSKLGSYKSGGFFWHDYEVYKKPEANGNKEKAEGEGMGDIG